MKIACAHTHSSGITAETGKKSEANNSILTLKILFIMRQIIEKSSTRCYKPGINHEFTVHFYFLILYFKGKVHPKLKYLLTIKFLVGNEKNMGYLLVIKA